MGLGAFRKGLFQNLGSRGGSGEPGWLIPEARKLQCPSLGAAELPAKKQHPFGNFNDGPRRQNFRFTMTEIGSKKPLERFPGLQRLSGRF